MHRKIVLVLGLAASVALTACGGNGAATTPTAPTAPPPPPTSSVSVPTDVLTYKNDLSRSGQNLTESTLTLANVTTSSFGLLRVLPADGKVDAQPLYISQLSVSGAMRSVVFAATENDSVYAFDANTGSILWQVSLLAAGETVSDMRDCTQVSPQIGVTSTPVIDRSAGAHGTLFVIAMSKDAASNYHQRLHALDLASGAELLGGPTEISATSPTAAGGVAMFVAGQYESERPCCCRTEPSIRAGPRTATSLPTLAGSSHIPRAPCPNPRCSTSPRTATAADLQFG